MSGFPALARLFRLMVEEHGSKTTNLDDFKTTMKEWAPRLTEPELEAVFDYFDDDDEGVIDYGAFMAGLRGDMSHRRLELVLEVFAMHDAYSKGSARKSRLVKFFDASMHPDVISGKKTPRHVKREFMDTFYPAHHDEPITATEFCDYYKDVSLQPPSLNFVCVGTFSTQLLSMDIVVIVSLKIAIQHFTRSAQVRRP